MTRERCPHHGCRGNIPFLLWPPPASVLRHNVVSGTILKFCAPHPTSSLSFWTLPACYFHPAHPQARSDSSTTIPTSAVPSTSSSSLSVSPPNSSRNLPQKGPETENRINCQSLLRIRMAQFTLNQLWEQLRPSPIQKAIIQNAVLAQHQSYHRHGSTTGHG